MIGAYGPYAASATGGNGWARDFLAGVLTIPATPFYLNIGPRDRNLQYAGTILACISALLVTAVYVVYLKGPWLRQRSPFAQDLASAQTTDPMRHPHIVSSLPSGEHVGEMQHHQHGHSHLQGQGVTEHTVERAPNPRIVVTGPVDSRPNTREGLERSWEDGLTHSASNVHGEDVTRGSENRAELSGETQVDDTEGIAKQHNG